MARELFGTDGIRGVANKYPMTADMALNLGKAVAHVFKSETDYPRIIVGRDTRVSGHLLEHAIVSGICSMGVDAIRVGVMTTPGIAYLSWSVRADAGIVISASHNPFEDNGIKIIGGDGYKLSDEKEEQIEKYILEPDILKDLYPKPEDLGRSSLLEDARGLYIGFLKSTIPKHLTLEGMNVALDCANGAAYKIAPQLFYEIEAEVEALYAKPNGININENCGSQHVETLSKTVIEGDYDIGLAFDGDADRLIAIDEKGNVITGDQIIAICANNLKEKGELANNTVVTTKMSNYGFRIAMKELDINNNITKVGDRYVLEEMQKSGAILGGEESGHIIFLNHHTTGDGILSALQVLKIMKETGKPLSELAKIMKVYPQKLINVTVSDKPALDTIPEVQSVIEEVEAELGDRGRVLVRYSGTQPLCRVMVEASTEASTDKYCQKIADVIEEHIGN
ncbi:MAG: phosphoglucosamine mutase [Promethearchaeota archaeon]|nr:MAG: phosphoglucosamine mutase [Candidatus Lokiarchaeota archaeon]